MDDFANHAGVEGARAASEKYLAEHQGVSGPVEVLSVQTQVVAGARGRRARWGRVIVLRGCAGCVSERG